MFNSISVNERDFIVSALESKFRVDARGPTDLRNIDIKFGTNTEHHPNNKNGQVLITMGHTKILTQTQLKLCSPMPGKPQTGFIKYNVEFDSLNHHSEFANQTQTLQEMRIEIQNFVEKITQSSRATDKEGLCIISGKLVWSISVQLFLLNDDGNLFDAFFLAAILALKNTRLPDVSLVRDKIRINDDKLKYLNVHHLPVCTTFYYIRNVANPIVDVNSKEERLCSSRLSIVMNTYEDICGMTTLGSLDIDQAEVFQNMKVALQKTKYITHLIRDRWDKKGQIFPMLDISNQNRPKQKSDFMQTLNQEIENNRLTNPSQEDEQAQNQSENEEMQEEQMVELIKQNAQLKEQNGARSSSGTREDQNSHITTSDDRAQRNIIMAQSQEKERNEAAKERSNRRKERLREIEDHDNVDLKSALKQRRSKRNR